MLYLIFPLMAKIVSLFVMVFAGVVLARSGLLRKEESLLLSEIFIYLLFPCVIVSSFSLRVYGTAGKNLLLCNSG